MERRFYPHSIRDVTRHSFSNASIVSGTLGWIFPIMRYHRDATHSVCPVHAVVSPLHDALALLAYLSGNGECPRT